VLSNNNIGTRPIPSADWIPASRSARRTVFGFVVIAIWSVSAMVMLNRTRSASSCRPPANRDRATAGGVDAKRMIVIGCCCPAPSPASRRSPSCSAATTPTPDFPAGLTDSPASRSRCSAGTTPAASRFGALLWAFLEVRGVLDNIQVPREIVTIMQGAIVLSVVVSYEVIRRLELAAEQRRVGSQLAALGRVTTGSAS